MPTKNFVVKNGISVGDVVIADTNGIVNSQYSNSAYQTANSAGSYANSAYTQANTANTLAQSAFDSANTKLASTGGSISGNLTISGNVTTNGIFTFNTSYVEDYSTVTITTNTLTLNLSNSCVFSTNLNSNITTLSLTNYPSTTSQVANFTLILSADGTARTVTWPASFKWPGGTAPTLTSTSGKIDVFTFFTLDNGTTWQAFISGQNL